MLPRIITFLALFYIEFCAIYVYISNKKSYSDNITEPVFNQKAMTVLVFCVWKIGIHDSNVNQEFPTIRFQLNVVISMKFTRSCQYDNFQCSQWLIISQNNFILMSFVSTKFTVGRWEIIHSTVRAMSTLHFDGSDPCHMCISSPRSSLST